jgi:hypothetical protein
MSIPYPTTTNYTDQVNYASYFPTEISSLIKKVPSNSEKFFGSQEDDYIELSVYDIDDNLSIWKPIVQPPNYQDRQIEYQDDKNNTIAVNYQEFVSSFILYENSKILLNPKSDLINLGISNGNYKMIYNFQSNIIGTYDKQCLLIKQISPSRKEIKVMLLLDKENFTNKDKTDFQEEFDCYVSSKIEARDILPDFSRYLKQTYLLNFVNTASDEIKNAFNRGYSVNGSEGLYKLLNEIYNGYQIVASPINGLTKDQNFIGISSYIMLMLYENYNKCFTYDEYSKILEHIVSETIKLRLHNIHDLETQDTLVCNTYLYDVFNSQIQSYLNSVNFDYTTKYIGPLKNSINFGENKSYKILSNKKFSDGSLVIKLQNPLPNTISVNSTFWITNTSLNPIIQKIVLVSLPSYDLFSIRPANFNLKTNDKRTSTSVTINDDDVLESNDVDLILRQRFSNINVDYTKFENFIIYSSAKTRIIIYKNKLNKINQKNATITELSSYTDTYTVNKVKNIQKEIDDIKLSFDGFEYSLYTNDLYNNLDIFPQSYEDDASEYDSANRDSLINNLPEYLLVNNDNDDFLIFLSMIGHHFDNIYVYIDKFPTLTYNSGGSEKLVPNKILNGMLASFGWNMESIINDVTLSKNYINGINVASISDKANIINNRILNSLPAILKAKGTIESVKLLLACYGVPNNMLNVREFGALSDMSQSLYSVDANVFLLNLKPESYIDIPYVGSTQTIEFKFAFSNHYTKSYNLLAEIDLMRKYSNNNADLDYRIYAYKEKLNNNGKIVFDIGGQQISSDLLPIFDGNVYNVMVRRNDPSPLYSASVDINSMPTKYDLYVELNEEGENRLHSNQYGILESTQNTLFSKENDSLLRFGSNQFSGSIDKINIWKVPIDSENFIEHGNNFESFYETDYNNIRNNLYFRLFYAYPRFLNTSDETYIYNGITSHLYNIPSEKTNPIASSVSVENDPELYHKTVDTRKLYKGNYSTSSLYPYVNMCIDDVSYTFPYNFIEYTLNQSYRLSNYGPNLLWNNKISIKDKPDVVSITPFVKSTPLNSNIDSNLVGIFASPVTDKNSEILKYFGDKPIINELGDPRAEFSSSYVALDNFRDVYYASGSPSSSGKILYQEFTSIYKLYFDSSIFDAIKNIVSVRTKLLTGLLIEPTLLERIKFPSKPINSEIIENTIEFTSLVNQSMENVTVLSNDVVQTNTTGTLNRFVDKIGIDTNPYDHTVVLNNNFGGDYVNDTFTPEELYVCGESNGNGFFITYVDINLLGSGQYSQSVPHYIWSVPYSASVENIGSNGDVQSYFKMFNKTVITPKSSYFGYQLGTPYSGCSRNHIGHRNNHFSAETIKILGKKSDTYGLFKRHSQTSFYTVDQCGDSDKSSPITSTIVTNTSVTTNSSGVLTVQ